MEEQSPCISILCISREIPITNWSTAFFTHLLLRPSTKPVVGQCLSIIFQPSWRFSVVRFQISRSQPSWRYPIWLHQQIHQPSLIDLFHLSTKSIDHLMATVYWVDLCLFYVLVYSRSMPINYANLFVDYEYCLSSRPLLTYPSSSIRFCWNSCLSTSICHRPSWCTWWPCKPTKLSILCSWPPWRTRRPSKLTKLSIFFSQPHRPHSSLHWPYTQSICPTIKKNLTTKSNKWCNMSLSSL